VPLGRERCDQRIDGDLGEAVLLANNLARHKCQAEDVSEQCDLWGDELYIDSYARELTAILVAALEEMSARECAHTG
jgi:hypothetical protein